MIKGLRMTITQEFVNIASWIAGGIFYDQIKIATMITYDSAKNSLAKLLPLNDKELNIIEAEIISCDKEIYKSQELLYAYISQNNIIQNIFTELESREPEKSREIVNSFKKNENSIFDLTLGDSDVVKSSFNNNLKRIDFEAKAHKVTKDEIIKILHPIAERGSLIMGNRMRAYLSAMFQYGIAFDNSTEAITRGVKFFIPFNPVTPVQKLLKREPPRERTLSEKEVQLFWQALDDSKIFICRKNVFKLMLATGQRLSEVAGLRWSEIEGDLWTLPGSRTKNRNKNLVPLN